MSLTQIIASDYPLPLIETESLCIGHRNFPHGKYGDGTDEADDYIKKDYKYSIMLEPNEETVSLFQKYLNEHMKNNSDVELWSIWLGAAFKYQYKYPPKLRNIDMTDDEIFDELDNCPPEITKKQTSIKELSKGDLLFFSDNLFVCMSIRK